MDEDESDPEQQEWVISGRREAMTAAQRKAAERQRRAEAGLVLVRVYAHPDDAQAIKDLAQVLARRRQKKNTARQD